MDMVYSFLVVFCMVHTVCMEFMWSQCIPVVQMRLMDTVQCGNSASRTLLRQIISCRCRLSGQQAPELY